MVCLNMFDVFLGGSGTIKVCKVLNLIMFQNDSWTHPGAKDLVNSSAACQAWGLKCSSNSESGPRELHQRNRWRCNFMSPCAPCAESPIHFLKLSPIFFFVHDPLISLTKQRGHIPFSQPSTCWRPYLCWFIRLFPPLCWYCPFTKKNISTTYQQRILPVNHHWPNSWRCWSSNCTCRTPGLGRVVEVAVIGSKFDSPLGSAIASAGAGRAVVAPGWTDGTWWHCC